MSDKTEYTYDQSPSPDVWKGDVMEEVAMEAWADNEKVKYGDNPLLGDTVTIYRGTVDPINHSELSLDIREHVENRLYEICGEAAEMTIMDESIQESFDKWLKDTVEINTWRVIDIAPIECVFNGFGWVVQDQAIDGGDV